MLDAGSGLYRSFPLLTQSALHILLSHAHLDHIVGLTYLWNATLHTPVKDIFVWGAHDKLDAIKEHLFSSLIFPAQPNITWCDLPASGKFQIGKTKIQSLPVIHPGGATAFRLDREQVSLGYVSDTTATSLSDYWSAMKGVSLLMHECNFRSQEAEFATKTGHTDLGNLIDCLKQHPMRRVLLTHLNTIDDQLLDELLEVVAQNPSLRTTRIEIASDGMIVKL